MSGIVSAAASLRRSPAAYSVSRNVRCLSDFTHDSSLVTSSPLSTAGSVFGFLPKGTVLTAQSRGYVVRYRKRSPQTAWLKVLQPTFRSLIRCS